MAGQQPAVGNNLQVRDRVQVLFNLRGDFLELGMGQRLAETLQANANGIAKRVSKMFHLMHGERLRTGHER